MLFAVTLHATTEAGHNVWFPFLHGAESVEALHERLLADGMVTGTRFKWRYEARGQMVVTDEFPFLLSKEGILSVRPLHRRLLRQNGEPV